MFPVGLLRPLHIFSLSSSQHGPRIQMATLLVLIVLSLRTISPYFRSLLALVLPTVLIKKRKIGMLPGFNETLSSFFCLKRTRLLGLAAITAVLHSEALHNDIGHFGAQVSTILRPILTILFDTPISTLEDQ